MSFMAPLTEHPQDSCTHYQDIETKTSEEFSVVLAYNAPTGFPGIIVFVPTDFESTTANYFGCNFSRASFNFLRPRRKNPARLFGSSKLIQLYRCKILNTVYEPCYEYKHYRAAIFTEVTIELLRLASSRKLSPRTLCNILGASKSSKSIDNHPPGVSTTSSSSRLELESSLSALRARLDHSRVLLEDSATAARERRISISSEFPFDEHANRPTSFPGYPHRVETVQHRSPTTSTSPRRPFTRFNTVNRGPSRRTKERGKLSKERGGRQTVKSH